MIGNNPVRGAPLAIGLDPGLINRGGNQRFEGINLIIVVGALQNSGNAFQPHAGID